MGWLRMVIRSLLGHTRYHDQAGRVQARVLESGRIHRDALNMRLDVRSRGNK
jgi:hypothetical protein